MKAWIEKHKLAANALVFLGMVLPAVPLASAAQSGNLPLLLLLLGLIISANIFALWIK